MSRSGGYRLIFESNPLPMWVYDLETLAFLDVNDAAVKGYGYSRDEFLSMSITDIRPPDDVPELLANLAARETSSERSGPGRHRTRDGQIHQVEVASEQIVYRGRPAALVVAIDVTARLEAETEKSDLQSQLHHSQRMEAVGRLAGSVAHDFNNLLAVIKNYAHLLNEQLGDEPGQAEIGEILKAAARAEQLIRQLVAFARRENVAPERVGVNQIVNDIGRLLQATVGSKIEIVVRLQPDLWPVSLMAGQMEQILINLAANARDAMPGGGRLLISTWNTPVTRSFASRHIELAAGRYVCLTVADGGTGVTDEVKDKMFEPFFSTKDERIGSGLGLSTVYGIVKAAGGSIFVYSELGVGTTFQIYLPATEPSASLRRSEAGRSTTGY